MMSGRILHGTKCECFHAGMGMTQLGPTCRWQEDHRVCCYCLESLPEKDMVGGYDFDSNFWVCEACFKYETYDSHNYKMLVAERENESSTESDEA